MIYGYHDRRGTFPNLVTGTAADYIDTATTNANITAMINGIRTYVGTTCGNTSGNGAGNTPASQAQAGIQYAVDKGYTSANATYQTGTATSLLSAIKTEIMADRPVLVGIANAGVGHAVVAYGYSSDTTSRMIRVNYGTGRTQTITQPSGTTSLWATADINVDSASLSVAGGTSGAVTSITKIKPGG